MVDFGIGVDLGGTNLRTAAISTDGKILDEFLMATPIEGPGEIIAGMVEGINRVRDSQGEGGLAGIGVGVPGLIELEKGLIKKAPNLPGWENLPLRDELQTKLGCPVLLENDANLAVKTLCGKTSKGLSKTLAKCWKNYANGLPRNWQRPHRLRNADRK